jgi:hypothetical protein
VAPGAELAECESCHGTFALTYQVRQRCAAKGRPTPRRCRACRDRRTLKAALETSQARLFLTGASDLVDEVTFAIADGGPEIVRAAHQRLTRWAQEQAS